MQKYTQFYKNKFIRTLRLSNIRTNWGWEHIKHDGFFKILVIKPSWCNMINSFLRQGANWGFIVACKRLLPNWIYQSIFSTDFILTNLFFYCLCRSSFHLYCLLAYLIIFYFLGMCILSLAFFVLLCYLYTIMLFI